ncbi:MAG: hypothetical protein AAF849_18140 [Bacteroidota bacterium]
MKKIISISIFLLICIAANNMPLHKRIGASKKILLERNTPVSLRLIETVNSEDLTAAVGNVVDLEVRIDVVREGEVLIRTGAFAEGYIHAITKKKGFGKGANIEIKARSVQTVDGQRAFLFGDPLVANASNKRRSLAWGLTLGLGIFGGLIDILRRKFGFVVAGMGMGLLLGLSVKGSNVELQMNESLNAYVAETITIEVFE